VWLVSRQPNAPGGAEPPRTFRYPLGGAQRLGRNSDEQRFVRSEGHVSRQTLADGEVVQLEYTKAPGKSRFDVKLTDPSGRILTLTRSSDFKYLVQRLFGAFSSGDSAGSDRSDGIEMTDKFNR
jgi:hypothetical protein